MQISDGSVFDIRRFSTHDGRGIRTTIFFKGCPLSCAWCHNPEGIDPKRRVMYFPNKCIGCGRCCHGSVNGGVSFREGKISLDIAKDENWDQIVEECPSGAMAWDSCRVSVEHVVDEALRDLPFYRYGGGVTLSGGEPLMQPEFAVEILKELKKHGVHTAIETALLVSDSALEAALPYLDFIYADCKLFDEQEHKRYTGVSNERIKAHIRFLLESEARENVTIRTPLIPGITATEENIGAISRFLSGIYDGTSYELLNYNPLAQAKYHLLDKEYYVKENPKRFGRQEMEYFAKIARENGVKQVIIEN